MPAECTSATWSTGSWETPVRAGALAASGRRPRGGPATPALGLCCSGPQPGSGEAAGRYFSSSSRGAREQNGHCVQLVHTIAGDLVRGQMQAAGEAGGGEKRGQKLDLLQTEATRLKQFCLSYIKPKSFPDHPQKQIPWAERLRSVHWLLRWGFPVSQVSYGPLLCHRVMPSSPEAGRSPRDRGEAGRRPCPSSAGAGPVRGGQVPSQTAGPSEAQSYPV